MTTMFFTDLYEMKNFCGGPHIHHLYQLPNHCTSGFREDFLWGKDGKIKKFKKTQIHYLYQQTMNENKSFGFVVFSGEDV